MSLAAHGAAVSSDRPWTDFLFQLTRVVRPHAVLELGTNIGMSGSYLAAALRTNGAGHLWTIEGIPDLAKAAQQTFQSAELDPWATSVVGGRSRMRCLQLYRTGHFNWCSSTATTMVTQPLTIIGRSNRTWTTTPSSCSTTSTGRAGCSKAGGQSPKIRTYAIARQSWDLVLSQLIDSTARERETKDTVRIVRRRRAINPYMCSILLTVW